MYKNKINLDKCNFNNKIIMENFMNKKKKINKFLVKNPETN